MTPSVLVLDLDGTTLTSTKSLTERDVAAAWALAAMGVDVTIATGRLWSGTSWVARALGVRGTVAVMNGCEIVDATTELSTYGRYVDRPSRPLLAEVLTEAGLPSFLYASRRIHHAHRDGRYASYLGIWSHAISAHPEVFDTAAWHEADDLVAVCAVGTHEVVDAARAEIDAGLPDHLHTVAYETYLGERFLEVRARDDKGTALHRLAADRGVTAAQCVVVGDWVNDVEMLREGGRSFVMGHSIEAVRVHADEVLTATRETGGAVAEVAQRVWGIPPHRG